MTSAARIASWMMLAATLPLLGETQPADPEEEHEKALSELEAATIEAFAELEGTYIVESVAPVFEVLQPLAESLPVVIADAVNAAGIRIQLGRLGIASATTDEGIQVYHVRPKSSAAQSGLQPHDTIVSINGSTVETILSDAEQVQVLASSVDEGEDPIIIVAVRDGEELEVEVAVDNKTGPGTVFRLPNVPSVTYVTPERGYRWELNYSTKSSKMISVLEIEKEIGYYFGVEFGVLVVDTPEEHNQLRPGDIVLRFDDNPIRSFSHLKKYSLESASSDSVKVRIKRRGRTMNVDFSPKEWFLTPAYEYK